VKRVAGATRSALLAAAADEFAAHGFAGASVDDIARRSGFNKAMIYYHFAGKEALFVEVLRDVFRLMGARTTEIAASALAPAAKIDAFIDALDLMAETHPFMPAIMVREIAEGARRLDRDTLRLMAVIFRNLAAILDQGARAGAFRRADPTLTYFSLIAPVIFYRATAPIREAFRRAGILRLEPGQPEFVANLKLTARAALAPDTERSSAGAEAPAHAQKASPAKSRRRSRSPRPGDHA
jgi:TetR/AcrR family transcriptional regulator